MFNELKGKARIEYSAKNNEYYAYDDNHFICGTNGFNKDKLEEMVKRSNEYEAQQQEIKELQAEIWELKGALQDRSKSCIAFDAANTKIKQQNAAMREVLEQARSAMIMARIYAKCTKHEVMNDIKKTIEVIEQVLNQSDSSKNIDSTQNLVEPNKLYPQEIDKPEMANKPIGEGEGLATLDKGCNTCMWLYKSNDVEPCVDCDRGSEYEDR